MPDVIDGFTIMSKADGERDGFAFLVKRKGQSSRDRVAEVALPLGMLIHRHAEAEAAIARAEQRGATDCKRFDDLCKREYRAYRRVLGYGPRDMD